VESEGYVAHDQPRIYLCLTLLDCIYHGQTSNRATPVKASWAFQFQLAYHRPGVPAPVHSRSAGAARSAGFQACCIAGFQTCATLAYHGRVMSDPSPWTAKQMSTQRIRSCPGTVAARGLRLASSAGILVFWWYFGVVFWGQISTFDILFSNVECRDLTPKARLKFQAFPKDTFVELEARVVLQMAKSIGGGIIVQNGLDGRQSWPGVPREHVDDLSGRYA